MLCREFPLTIKAIEQLVFFQKPLFEPIGQLACIDRQFVQGKATDMNMDAFDQAHHQLPQTRQAPLIRDTHVVHRVDIGVQSLDGGGETFCAWDENVFRRRHVVIFSVNFCLDQLFRRQAHALDEIDKPEGQIVFRDFGKGFFQSLAVSVSVSFYENAVDEAQSPPDAGPIFYGVF